MARPSKNSAIDFTIAHNLTHGLLERATCPPERAFVLVKDADKKGLRLRVTKAGGKYWQFETRMLGKLITRALGEWPTVGIEQARAEAHRLRGMTEQGTDPREIERQQQAEREAEAQRQLEAQQATKAATVTVGEAWAEYVTERTPHWGELHRIDHARLAQAGGAAINRRGTRGRDVTQPGPLHSLMALALVDLTPQTVEAWAAREGKTRPTVARLAWRLLRAFLTWCAEHHQLSALMAGGNPCKTKKARESLGKARAKQDALLKEQLPAWFAHVRAIGNPCACAYLQILLLTGARPGEVLAMRWDDLNTQWRGLTVRDKVEGERTIPLTPYVHHLIAALPRRNGWVFSSLTTNSTMSKPHKLHATACAAAGIDGLTMHGLRRSFKSLTEWLECPAGVVAQIMGHKPSATAEKHYTVRPLDLLRIHHEKIEAFILEQAGVQFDRAATPGKLALVA